MSYTQCELFLNISTEKEKKVTTSAIRILTVLSRINYDIIKPLLKDVFWGFLTVSTQIYWQLVRF